VSYDVSCYWLSARCEIRSAVRFLPAGDLNFAEVRSEQWTVYGQNVISKGTARQRRRMLKYGRRNILGEERSSRPVIRGEAVPTDGQKMTPHDFRAFRGISSHFTQSSLWDWSLLWSSGHSYWLQIQRSRVWFLALPDFPRSGVSGTGSTQPREDNWGADLKTSSDSGLQGGPDSIRQFLIINNRSIQQHTGKWKSTFCCR
jgi:hypothetical protein